MPLTRFKDKDGKYRWRLTASNGRKLLSGEAYYQKSNTDRAKAPILVAMAEALIENGIEISNGKIFFT